MDSLEQGSGLVPDVSPDAFAVAPEFDSTEELRVEIYDNEESCPVRYTSDVRLLLHTKDLASRAGSVDVCKNGAGIDFSEDIAKTVLLEDEIEILVSVGDGPAAATAWGCDLTYDYVKINGDYRS